MTRTTAKTKPSSPDLAVRTFWVVSDPTPTSELADILWESTPSRYYLTALGAGTRYSEAGFSAPDNTPEIEHWMIYLTREAALSDPRVIAMTGRAR